MVVVARRQELLDALAERITTAGGEATAIACDVSDMDAVDALVADVEKRFGGIDILINNAGRSIRRPLASRWSAGTTSSGPWCSTTTRRCS